MFNLKVEELNEVSLTEFEIGQEEAHDSSLMWILKGLLRLLLTLLVACAGAILSAYVSIEIFTARYMSSNRISDIRELSEDYGFGILTVPILAISAGLGFIAAGWLGRHISARIGQVTSPGTEDG